MTPMAKTVRASAAAKAKAGRRAATGNGTIKLTANQRRAVSRSATTGRFVSKSASRKTSGKTLNSSKATVVRSTARKKG